MPKNLNRAKSINHTNFRLTALINYIIEGRGVDRVANNSDNVIRQCSFLVNRTMFYPKVT